MPLLGGDGRLWLHSTGAHDVALTGTGTIDGRGVAFMSEETPTIFKTKAGRPFLLHLEDCRGVTLRGVRFADAPFWALHLLGCRDVAVDSVRIENHPKIPNSDGIDINRCRNVRIAGCTVAGGDDAVCIKSEADGARYGACEDVVVTGCTLQSTSCAVKIGSGTAGDVRRVLVTACSVYDSHRGLGIQFRDGGLVEDVLFSDITVQTRHVPGNWWGDATPIYVTALRRSPGSPLGRVRDVRFSNIRCRSQNGVLVLGAAPEHLSGIELENVTVDIEPSDRPAGRYDLRPCADRPDVLEGPSDGFHLRGAAGVSVRHCRVRWPAHPAAYLRHALHARDCPGLSLHDLAGTSAFPDRLPAVDVA
jgi:hypothetical protein